MKDEGAVSKAPLKETFGQWSNAKIALLALLGLTAGQAVIWYTGQFYALFFLQSILKIDSFTANVLIAWSLVLGTGGFIVFGSLSDKIGRKPIILAGCLLGALTYFPLFDLLVKTANPALYKAQETKVTVVASSSDCSFQFNPTGTVKFTNSCDIAKQALASRSVRYSTELTAAPGTPAVIKIGDTNVASFDAGPVIAAATAEAQKTSLDAKKTEGLIAAKIAEKMGPFNKGVGDVLAKAGYPDVSKPVPGAVRIQIEPKDGLANFAKMFDVFDAQKLTIIGILTILVIYVTMVYGPVAAALVELFPTRIRYSGLSLPYHIGNGWFGGLLPATSFAIVAQTGDLYAGLWYPICVALMTVVIGTLLVPETYKRDIFKS